MLGLGMLHACACLCRASKYLCSDLRPCVRSLLWHMRCCSPQVAGPLRTHDSSAQAVTSINNVVLGRITLEHKGSYAVRCVPAGLTACMKLHASSMLTSKARMHEVQGSPPRPVCPDFKNTCNDAIAPV